MVRSRHNDARIKEQLDKISVGDIFQVTNPRTPFLFLGLPIELRHRVYKIPLSIDANYVSCASIRQACKKEHRYTVNEFWELNDPLGYYRPFSDPSRVAFYLNGRAFLYLTTIETRAAQWKLERKIWDISALYKMHLLVRSDLFVQGGVADKIFFPVEKNLDLEEKALPELQQQQLQEKARS
ncbi:hypothetical protein EG328_002174 [Venturia inaequalis]|uniref:Uncharacterized protein n=1 Tax=Venturia inaequalis TaxID=5025 RepID=A0A8H3VPN0_VENIN|nr:hypothetical protein EG328_002174 [Venturia inaequalis]KAE9990634.1 hypothetical protein EG327_001134 [Venturia inaequalis]